MEVLLAVVSIAVLIQAIVEGVKGALSKWDWISLALGTVLCPLAGIDAFALLGVPLSTPFAPWVGSGLGAVLTGGRVGRGAAAVYDVWRRIKGELDNTNTD